MNIESLPIGTLLLDTVMGVVYRKVYATIQPPRFAGTDHQNWRAQGAGIGGSWGSISTLSVDTYENLVAEYEEGQTVTVIWTPAI